MYKTIWNYVSKHSKKSSIASVFLPVLVLGWAVYRGVVNPHTAVDL